MFGSVPGAIVSCAASAWIWLTLVVLDDRSPARADAQRRYVSMLAPLAALDFADGLAYVVGLGNDDEGMCLAQALLFQTVEPAIFVWTACMACELWFVVVGPSATASEAPLRTSLLSDGGGGLMPLATGKHGHAEAALARRHRMYKAVTALVPLLLAAVVLLGWGPRVLGSDQLATAWCWISSDYQYLQMFTYYAVFVLAFAFICGTYVRLGLFLRSETRVLGAGRRRRVLRMAVFPLLFALVWVWEFVEHLYLWTDRPVPGVVTTLASAATSMSGVSNALAYGLKNPRVALVWGRLACPGARPSSEVELRNSASEEDFG